MTEDELTTDRTDRTVLTKTSKIQLAERRREAVSRLRAKGLTIYEIQDALGDEYNNPISGNRPSVQAISQDLKIITERWKAECNKTIDVLKADQLERLLDLYAECRATNDHKSATKVLELLDKMFGISSEKVQLLLPVNAEESIKNELLSKLQATNTPTDTKPED